MFIVVDFTSGDVHVDINTGRALIQEYTITAASKYMAVGYSVVADCVAIKLDAVIATGVDAKMFQYKSSTCY